MLLCEVIGRVLFSFEVLTYFLLLPSACLTTKLFEVSVDKIGTWFESYINESVYEAMGLQGLGNFYSP